MTKAFDGTSYPLIDGGALISNPAIGAQSEVPNAGDSTKSDVLFIVSLVRAELTAPATTTGPEIGGQ